MSLSFTEINGHHVDVSYPHIIVSSQDGFRLLCAVCVGVTVSSSPVVTSSGRYIFSQGYSL